MEAETPPSVRRVDGTPTSRIRESGPPRRRTRDVATAAHCLPSGLSPSVQEFHLVNRPLAADGSRTVTAGSDFHRPRSALTSLVRAQCAMSISAGGRRPPCGLAHPPSTDPGSWPPVPAPGADSPPRPFPNRGHGPRPPGSAGTSSADAPEATAATRRGPTPAPAIGGAAGPRTRHAPDPRATRTLQSPAARRRHIWGGAGPCGVGAGFGRGGGLPSARGGGGRYPWAMLSSCSTAGRSAHRSPPGGAWSLSTAARASRSPASAAAWTMSLAA
ncbi:hypothetical protein GA0115260_103739 [Streptomyces sp. MnatMP-M27]|nr:hypothetical protein GA0115260_103739 [Streptomyces sp. MnatMP-M27]